MDFENLEILKTVFFHHFLSLAYSTKGDFYKHRLKFKMFLMNPAPEFFLNFDIQKFNMKYKKKAACAETKFKSSRKTLFWKTQMVPAIST